MYLIGDQDSVVELTGLPQCSVGAPCPMVLSGEGFLHLAYELGEMGGERSDVNPCATGKGSGDALCALVRFRSVCTYTFGPPNDETFSSHPLAARGLQLYAVSEVKESSWIRQMERMNSVHRMHNSARYARFRHFIFAFHDNMLECIAEGFEISIHRGSVSTVLRNSWTSR
jgi:hypothetical protein